MPTENFAICTCAGCHPVAPIAGSIGARCASCKSRIWQSPSCVAAMAANGIEVALCTHCAALRIKAQPQLQVPVAVAFDLLAAKRQVREATARQHEMN